MSAFVQGSLFHDEMVGVPLPAEFVPGPKRGTASVMHWELSDHACKNCFGRILQRKWRGKIFEVRCANCGAQQFGDVTDLCCCGADCGALGKALECVKNPNVSKEVPHEVLVRERAEGSE